MRQTSDYMLHSLRARLILLALALTGTSAAQTPVFSTLPILHVDIAHGQINRDAKTLVPCTLYAGGAGGRNVIGQTRADYRGQVAIKGRGATSWWLFPKTGYSIELRGPDGRDTSVSLLGMPAEEDWILHGPYSDKTLLRNALVYSLAGEIMAYAPRTRYVELVLGGDRRGVYLLTERIKRDRGRVAIKKLEAADSTGLALTGGYILKVDKADGEPGEGFRLPPPGGDPGARTTTLLHHYPKPSRITAPQRDYIEAFMTDVEARLASADYEDPVRGYPAVIDSESFADYLLLSELSRNIDAYRISTYFYKDRDDVDGRLHAGPAWDFNLGFGNANYCGADRVDGWSYEFESVCPGDMYQAPFWWTRLMSSQDFRRTVRDRYRALRRPGRLLADASLLERVDSLASLVDDEMFDRNEDRWQTLGNYVWPNPFVGSTRAEDLDYLKDWLARRARWMDGALDALVFADEPVSTERNAPWHVYPNPATDQLFFSGFSESNFPLTIEIANVSGRRLRQMTIEQPSLLLTGLPAGVYVLRVRAIGGGGWSSAERIVVR